MSFAKFGDTNIEVTLGNSFGLLTAARFRCSSAGKLRAILQNLAYISVCKVRHALYADSAGEPGALLAEGPEVDVLAAGWQISLMPAVSLLDNTFYWLAFQYDQSNSLTRYASSGGTGRYRSYTYGNFPNPFGAATSVAYLISIYAEYHEDRIPLRG